VKAPPYRDVSIDFVTLSPFLALSIQCLNTKHLALIHVKQCRASDAVHALEKHRKRLGIKYQRILSDLGPAFRAKEFAQYVASQATSVLHECIDAGSHYQLPVEVAHKSILRMIRVRRLTDSTDSDVQEDFDEVAGVFNHQPVGIIEGDVVLTPSLLAFGLHPNGTSRVPSSIESIREQYFSIVFNQLRERSGTRLNSRSKGFSIHLNERVLVYTQSVKTVFPYRYGRVEKLDKHRVGVRTRGEFKWYGSAEVVPLTVAPPAPFSVSRVGSRVTSAGRSGICVRDEEVRILARFDGEDLCTWVDFEDIDDLPHGVSDREGRVPIESSESQNPILHGT
jgi:hypothetical protein